MEASTQVSGNRVYQASGHYVFVVQWPTQRVRPQRTKCGQWFCRWKVYDERGKCVRQNSGFIGKKKNKRYAEALNYFSDLASRDRLQRPIGLFPLSPSVLQKQVHRIGLRVGLRIYPHPFATPSRLTYWITELTCESFNSYWGTDLSVVPKSTLTSAKSNFSKLLINAIPNLSKPRFCQAGAECLIRKESLPESSKSSCPGSLTKSS